MQTECKTHSDLRDERRETGDVRQKTEDGRLGVGCGVCERQDGTPKYQKFPTCFAASLDNKSHEKKFSTPRHVYFWPPFFDALIRMTHS